MSDERTVKTVKFINTSGKGNSVRVPSEIKNKFNWGAFLLSWIWGLGNKTYFLLIYMALIFIPVIFWIVSGMSGWLRINTIMKLSYMIFLFIPIIDLIVSIWFGIKGNEWAWQNKKFSGIKHFNEYQSQWTVAGIIFWIIFTPVLIGIMITGLIVYSIDNSGNNPEKFERTMTRLENIMEKAVDTYFETYTIDENENRFYILEDEWKLMSFSEKKDLFDLAAQTASTKREREYKINNPNGHEYFSKTQELKRTKIYSANNNEKLLGEFYFDDSIFDKQDAGFTDLMKAGMTAYRFYN